MKKRYVAVRAAYYKHDKVTKNIKKNHLVEQQQSDGSIKSILHTQVSERSYKSAIAEFDHVLRSGKTNSINVFDELSSNNVTFSPKGSSNPLDAYYKYLNKYKRVVGRKCRSDMNTLFEHVVVLSEEHVSWLENKLGKEKAKQEIVKCLKAYTKNYADKYKFSACGGSLHLDEGFHNENGKFVRNVHAHIMFFNYDFKTKKSYLRTLFKKSIDPLTGKTNELNNNFVDIQDLAYQAFAPLKFMRGKSKLLTMTKYLPKHQFLMEKLKRSRRKYQQLAEQIKVKKLELNEYLEKWFSKLMSKESAKVEASLSAELTLDIQDKTIRHGIEKTIKNMEQTIQSHTHVKKINSDDSIAEQIKNKSNSRKKI